MPPTRTRRQRTSSRRRRSGVTSARRPSTPPNARRPTSSSSGPGRRALRPHLSTRPARSPSTSTQRVSRTGRTWRRRPRRSCVSSAPRARPSWKKRGPILRPTAACSSRGSRSSARPRRSAD
eukprot:4604123-Pyramimonas_sp.AAC.1